MRNGNEIAGAIELMLKGGVREADAWAGEVIDTYRTIMAAS